MLDSRTVAIAIALALSLGANLMQWQNADTLRGMAGAACKAGLADIGECSRRGLD